MRLQASGAVDRVVAVAQHVSRGVEAREEVGVERVTQGAEGLDEHIRQEDASHENARGVRQPPGDCIPHTGKVRTSRAATRAATASLPAMAVR